VVHVGAQEVIDARLHMLEAILEVGQANDDLELLVSIRCVC